MSTRSLDTGTPEDASGVAAPIDSAARSRMARRAGVAAFVGTTIEIFDFYIYSTASALVLGALFFPTVSPAIGTLVAFATIWVGFIARPLGGVIFGHFGDRLGRKKMLMITLTMMGIATIMVGLLPTYGQIGIAAPLLLVTVRMLQGIAIGGEWGGAVLIATEHAPKKKSILFGAFAQQGSPVGNLLGTLAFIAITQLPEEQFTSWGWRIPFLFSAVLVIVGIVIRTRLEESPEMESLRRSSTVVRLPLAEVLRSTPKVVVLGILAGAIGMASSYVKTTFALSWATEDIGFSRSTFLMVIMIALIAQVLAQPFGAVLATRFDTRNAIVWILVPEIFLMPLMFYLIGTGSTALAIVGMVLATFPHSMFYATLAGILSNAFPARTRYTGISVCYQMSTTVFAGTAPFLCQYLLTTTGSITSVVALTIGYVVLSLVCSLALLNRTPAPHE
ncbi:MFS transporter [Saccharopolyspora elongata]|uniref:MFS transporter n=2 Tax=Saccharopolyspora elongata TaxID=2530387 RepID=A0A4R4YHB0_9PSEU|nr:MFS transporter [Saccharopolyspora elongata]TDD44261.1 MFS transporter [Saccharopolyspora elongata]